VEDAHAPGEDLPNARRHLRLRVKGVWLEWEETPFEWYRPWRFGVVRRYGRGPLREMRVLAVLDSLGEHRTRLTYSVSARPRGLFGLLTTPIQIGLISRITFGRTFRDYALSTAGKGRAAAPPATGPAAEDLDRRLRAAGVAAAVAPPLASHLSSADDMTLTRIRPYELAERWGLPRKDVLVACLQATRGGVLDLGWDILCPACRGATDSADTLRNLRLGAAHCDTCLIDFSPGFDQSVELSFHPNATVRSVSASPFCVAGPQVTPHVEVQQLLGPGEERVVEPRLTPGRHRLRSLGAAGPSFLVEAGGPEEATVVLTADGWGTLPSTLGSEARIRLVNRRDHECLVCVESTSWGDSAATAAEVTALAEFRDLFSSEVLADGAFAKVGSLAILFTDLRDSTAMYRRVGDATAFSRVMRHFDRLSSAVRVGEGTVVKTIGDAVMAVFPSMAAALRAALNAQEALARPAPEEEGLVLKAGVHFGPAIAVTLNQRLDYFGTTVNVAARLGGLSSGHDVVISDRVRNDEGVRSLLEELGATVSSATADIRGLEDRMLVWRVSLPRPPESSPAT
jgi:class 3 adenylate cyclase